jgi:hypothetical protein
LGNHASEGHGQRPRARSRQRPTNHRQQHENRGRDVERRVHERRQLRGQGQGGDRSVVPEGSEDQGHGRADHGQGLDSGHQAHRPRGSPVADHADQDQHREPPPGDVGEVRRAGKSGYAEGVPGQLADQPASRGRRPQRPASAVSRCRGPPREQRAGQGTAGRRGPRHTSHETWEESRPVGLIRTEMMATPAGNPTSHTAGDPLNRRCHTSSLSAPEPPRVRPGPEDRHSSGLLRPTLYRLRP